MKRGLCIATAFFLSCLACLGAAPVYAPEVPSHKVATCLLTWHDNARNRDIPVKIYYPADAKSPCPMIIFSHGLGGTRDGYSYLGEHWAGCGYISVHVQHLGSDDSVWRGAGIQAMAAMRQAVTDPSNSINRVEDVAYAIDQMLALNRLQVLGGYDPFRGLVNENAIGMAGHSFGAWTTLAVTGERFPGNRTFINPHIKAAIAMSAPVPGGAKGSAGAFSGIAVPVFHMTGTLDNSPIGDTVASERRIPFDQSTVPGSCLLILTGADHMTFSGHVVRLLHPDDARFQALILAGSTAFWDATLRGDASARAWLYQGGFAKLLGKAGTFETR